ncbi:MAG: DEAD/DEAH box helicase [Armatimonadota bacterium]
MSKTDLQKWLLQIPGFKARFQRLVIDSVANQFPELRRDDSQQEDHDWGYLLMCASLCAQSENGCCQDVALRIAQFCLEQSDVKPTRKDAAAVVLDSLANQPAIKLAQRRNLLQEGFADRLPFPLLQDWTRRSIENSITLADSRTITVNHFQRIFWQRAHEQDWISLSAPTSAGKSYILGRWLADYLRDSPQATIVYLVPTRALIQQVQQDIERLLREEHIDGVSITTLPLRSSVHMNTANVLVFTQERFHILLGQYGPDTHIDLLIVDEAQKIGDSYRGVLLQQAIETAVHRNPACRVVFASPMTENPGILLEDAPPEVSQAPIRREDTMVNQNLIWVSQARGKPKDWDVELVLDAQPIKIGRIELSTSPTSESKRLPFVAFALSNPSGGNVLYVNGAADAEKAAKQIYDLLGDSADMSSEQEIRDLVELIQKTVHREYSLARVLLRGVAFHYGNIPLLIRTEIERLFRENKIKYLICTSTLIEGVNMPCQSIFARGPTKGRGKPMAPSDFWNLAGRAGRWGNEFQGNVICVDAKLKNVWKNGAPKSRASFKITRTSDKVLSDVEALLKFISNGTPRDEARREPNLEYVFSYLVSCHSLNGSIARATWTQRFPEEDIQRVSEAVQQCADSLRTPVAIVHRNPGISPIAMDGLLDYFDDRTSNRRKAVEELLPVPPESEDGVSEYTKVLHRINSHLGDEFGRNGRVSQLALLIVDWMRGYPLARIIASREAYYRSQGADINIPEMIRSTMSDVEQIARFQAPRFLACYVDLLRVYLESIGRQDLVAERLFELNVLLEFGVSQQTQLSLMGLGLSRSSAISLSELITDDALDEADCLKWLRENDWMTEDMPALIKREIHDLARKLSR